MEQPPVRQQEQAITPEKSAEELYLDALEKKRDTLLAFHTMNAFRKGKTSKEMTDDEIGQYKILRDDWQSKKEKSLGLWDALPEDKQDELAAMGSRLYDVQAELTLLTPKLTVAETESKQEEQPPLTESAISETKSPEQPTAEKPESALSLAEVDDYLARLGKSKPAPLLAVEAWKIKRAELAERQEAEANPDRTPPKGFLARVKKAFTFANAIAGNQETVESRMSPLGLRKEATGPAPLEKSAEPMPLSTQLETKPRVHPELWEPKAESKKAGVWGWLKERGKGILSLGIWELHQAERFRTKTKEVANDTEALAGLIQQERNLLPEEAEKEAWETVAELKKNNLDISAPEFYQINKDITERKRKENNDEIEYIIKSAVSNLAEKLAKYRGESGQDILTRENQLAFEADLRGELNKMRDGAARKDFINFAKLMRRNLDRDWWIRYTWTANEAIWGFSGINWLVMKYEALKAAQLLAVEKAAIGGTEAGIAAAHESLMGHLQQSIWQDLANSGVPTEKLPELTDQVLKSNNLSDRVLEGIKGGLDAWRLPNNFAVDYSSVSQKLLELGANLAKLGVR